MNAVRRLAAALAGLVVLNVLLLHLGAVVTWTCLALAELFSL